MAMSLHAPLKFGGILGLLLGGGTIFLLYPEPIEKLGPFSGTDHAEMAVPMSVQPHVSEPDLMETVPELPLIIRDNGVVLLGANVRANPNAGALVLRTVRSQTYVRIFAHQAKWLQVGDSRPWGWVHVSRTENFVGAPSPDHSPTASTASVAELPRMARDRGPAPNAPTDYIGEKLLGANVRVDSRAGAQVLRTIGSGMRVRVFARRDGWLQVGDSEPWGWVHVSRTEGFAVLPPSPSPPLAVGEAHSEQPCCIDSQIGWGIY